MRSPYFFEKLLWTVIIILVGFLSGFIIDGWAVSRGILWQGRLMADLVPLIVILVSRHKDIMNWKPSDLYLNWMKELDEKEMEKENKERLKFLPVPL